MDDTTTIGQAAAGSGVSAKMIRHYEEAGLFARPARSDAGYRRYTPADVHTLRFIRRARDLGFSIRQIGELVGLWQDRGRPSRQVKALAQAHIDALERKVQALLAMKATLGHLVRCCHGDDRPNCPILDGLAEDGVATADGSGNGAAGTADSGTADAPDTGAADSAAPAGGGACGCRYGGSRL